ncbi:3-dehydro-L-gulonate 2-dehydrogenase [Halomonas salipaludis]|uniref:3-dehydro-L-gulonate 2-dehydrogenase n=1 Tax=Halomonas salipaludis TaxID=2032625 RepID=A0A2A2EZZ4_9GAMM|nr:3-dehydro-L-gulonate 2-dehydrogenase [Halomonas salipaludis]PAU77912.1 3-dehydro-L-gulonate 2-dehydrogenase [Halomonas salipaludis]
MSAIVSLDALYDTIERALSRAGVSAEDAAVCARIHAESTRDGVASHGINRIPRLIDYIKRGWVNPYTSLSLIHSMGTIESYDGGFGLGVGNAMLATQRAMELARVHGVGIVTIRDTTHWMRGGSYAWHAVEQGFSAIMWTNTESCMPAWGAVEQSIGNNPLVIAVPGDPVPLVLDIAMSQFSYGRLASTAERGESLPVDGGFDVDGDLSRDPKAIQSSRRLLPMGYWKGSGLAILLDAMAAMLAQGRSGHRIDELQRGSGTGCCQVFMVFDPEHLGGRQMCNELVDGMTSHLSSLAPDAPDGSVRWPGASTFQRRVGDSQVIRVSEEIWQQIRALAGD